MLLIGSRALKLRAPNLLFRQPLDFDFIGSKIEIYDWLSKNEKKINPIKIYEENDGKKVICEGSVNCEFEVEEKIPSCGLLKELIEKDPETISTSFGLIPNVDLLFTIKTSHRYLKNSPHFWKTFQDWHMLKSAGAEVRPEYMEFLHQREKETYSYLHPKLNVTKKEFFSEDFGVHYTYQHDDIHESIKKFEKPAYRFYMKDGSEVMSDKTKFFACDREIQLWGVVEEACTLAIERSLVPHPGVLTPRQAWMFALSKVCSSITSGWFRQFAYENGPEVIGMYPEGYWEKFQSDVKNGLVRLAK